ncbi:hypothetical protein VTK26DRAFT_4386 [Humicola hyalothermophila]
MSGIVNKIKDAVHGDKGHHGAPEGTHGPHNSRTANAMDPRVDSDRDNSRNMGMSTDSTGRTGRTAGHGETGGSYMGTSGASEGTYGPHSGRTANAMDPRVDSDRDNSRNMGMSTGATSRTGHTAGGLGTGTAEGTYGPHSSRTANAADPRVDSDRDNSRTMGAGTGTGSGGLGTRTAGSHRSDMANKMDPRVDSDLDGSRTMGGNRTYQ